MLSSLFPSGLRSNLGDCIFSRLSGCRSEVLSSPFFFSSMFLTQCGSNSSGLLGFTHYLWQAVTLGLSPSDSFVVVVVVVVVVDINYITILKTRPAVHCQT